MAKLNRFTIKHSISKNFQTVEMSAEFMADELVPLRIQTIRASRELFEALVQSALCREVLDTDEAKRRLTSSNEHHDRLHEGLKTKLQKEFSDEIIKQNPSLVEGS